MENKFTIAQIRVYLAYKHSIDQALDNLTEENIMKANEDDFKYELKMQAAKAAAEKGETTISKEKWGVHETHCCYKHGCKYGDPDCPVEIGLVKQEYPCEFCTYDDRQALDKD